MAITAVFGNLMKLTLAMRFGHPHFWRNVPWGNSYWTICAMVCQVGKTVPSVKRLHSELENHHL